MVWFVIFGFILGSVLGSFTKAIADRVMREESVFGRSYCPHCKKRLRWYDLFPLISYLALKGKCRYCKRRIPFEYFLAEVGLGLSVATLFAISFPKETAILANFDFQSGLFLADLLFKTSVLVILAAVFLIDLKTGLIPDKIIFPATTITVFYLLATHSIKSFMFYRQLQESQIGRYLLPPYSNYFLDNLQRLWTTPFLSFLSALAAALTFALLIIITRGKGMGWGDVKYVFFLGLVLGFPHTATALFLSFVLGAVFALILIFLGKKRLGQTIPFGPFLSLGAAATLFWGAQIISWYLR